MKARQPEFRAIPQFDAGRWKLRLERVPDSTDKRPDNTQPWIPQPSRGRNNQVTSESGGVTLSVKTM
jgi:hypothetical protein